MMCLGPLELHNLACLLWGLCIGEKTMNIKRLSGIVILIMALVMGCSGNSGKLKNQSENDSKITQQELIDNWSDYKISLDYRNTSELTVIVFDPNT